MSSEPKNKIIEILGSYYKKDGFSYKIMSRFINSLTSYELFQSTTNIKAKNHTLISDDKIFFIIEILINNTKEYLDNLDRYQYEDNKNPNKPNRDKEKHIEHIKEVIKLLKDTYQMDGIYRVFSEPKAKTGYSDEHIKIDMQQYIYPFLEALELDIQSIINGDKEKFHDDKKRLHKEISQTYNMGGASVYIGKAKTDEIITTYKKNIDKDFKNRLVEKLSKHTECSDKWLHFHIGLFIKHLKEPFSNKNQ